MPQIDRLPLRLLGGLSEWTTATGEHYRLKASLVQGLWVGGLLLLGGTLLLARYDRWRTGASLALLGLTAYLIVFEARPRYLLALLPVVLAAGLTSHRTTRQRLDTHEEPGLATSPTA